MVHANKLRIMQQGFANQAMPQTKRSAPHFFKILLFMLLMSTKTSYGVCFHEILPPTQITICLGNPLVLDFDLCDSISEGDPVKLWWYMTNTSSPGAPAVLIGTQIVTSNGSSMPLNFASTGVYTVHFIVTPPSATNSNTNSSGSNNSATVTVIDQAPQGNFNPPYVNCTGSATYIHFSVLNATWQDLNSANCYIDYGDSSGLVPLSYWTWTALTNGNGLSYYYSSTGLYTVTLYLENACGSNAFTQDYIIKDQISLNPVDITICENTVSTVDLTVYAPPGIQVNWYDGQTLIGSGDPLTIPAPLATTVYTAEAITNCSSPASLTVTVVSQGRIDIVGPSNDCATGIQAYSINYAYSGVVYNWSISGGLIVSANADSTVIWVDWNSVAALGAGVLSAWSDSMPCLMAGVFYVEPCCSKGTRNTLFIDGDAGMTFSNALGVQSGSSVVLSSAGFLVGFNMYGNILLNGNVIVDVDLHFDNYLMVNMMPNAAITVSTGNRLTIDNHSIVKAGCKEMWKSITVENGAELILNNGAVIQDAYCGTILTGDAKITTGNSGDKVVYNKNYYGMAFMFHNEPAHVLIRNTKFICQASSTTFNTDDLLIPHQGEHSAVGIYLFATKAMLTIGESINGKHNEFDNLDYGILANASQFYAINNEFTHIKDTLSIYDCQCKCPKGVAICADGYGIPDGIVAHIGDYSQYSSNSVTDSDYGFFLVNNMNGIVRNNNLLRTRYDAMNLNENWLRPGFYEVNKNTSKDIGPASYHIFMNNNPNVDKEINNNEINELYTPANLYSTGIGIFEMVKSPANVSIDDNDLYNLRTGIYTMGVNQALIARNEIVLNADPTGVYGAGISVNKGARCAISENTISTSDRNKWWVDGIRITDVSRSNVNCNLMQQTASGIFLNGNCSGTYIRQNNMRSNYWGYILNYAINPIQQSGFYSDNIWTGSYDNNPGGGTYWHTLNLHSNVFNNSMNVRPYSGQGNVYKPNPFYASSVGGLNFAPHATSSTAGPIYYPGGLNQHSGCNQDTTDGDPQRILPQIISGKFDGYEFKEEAKWLLRYQLYETMTEKDLEEIKDPALKQFVDSMGNSPAGSLLAVNKAMSVNDDIGLEDLMGIRSTNKGISTGNTIEYLYKLMNDYILQALINDRNSEADENLPVDNIRKVAMMCPFESGPAVYLARALHNKISSDKITFLNLCETANPNAGSEARTIGDSESYLNDKSDAGNSNSRTPESQIGKAEVSVFPNPANEIVNIISSKPILRIEMSDVMGKGMHYIQGNDIISMNIPLKDFAKGIYLVKIYHAENDFTVKKLIIAH